MKAIIFTALLALSLPVYADLLEGSVKFCTLDGCFSKSPEDEEITAYMQEFLKQSKNSSFTTCQYEINKNKCSRSFLIFDARGIGIFAGRTGFRGFKVDEISQSPELSLKITIHNYPWVFGEVLDESNVEQVSHQRCEPALFRVEQSKNSYRLVARNYRCHGRVYSFRNTFTLTLRELNLTTGHHIFRYEIEMTDGATGKGEGYTRLDFSPVLSSVLKNVVPTNVAISGEGQNQGSEKNNRTPEKVGERKQQNSVFQTQAPKISTDTPQIGPVTENQVNKTNPVITKKDESSSAANISAINKNSERRVALVIGNSDYRNAPLNNPVNDAADINNALQSMGFRTVLLKNANIRDLREATRKFSEMANQSDVALIFYAGHGVEVKGRNYLIPVAADIKHEYELEDQAFDAGRWLNMLESIRENKNQRINILILDACRDNSFSRGWRSSSRGLVRMDAPTGTFIAFATAPGRVASDGDHRQRNSPFTKSLLKALEKPNLPIELMFKEVRRMVLEETKGEQTPWDNSSLVGDFFFRRSN